jgi:hypothetical protein
MRFDRVQTIFYRYIHRRYHRYCREIFAQLCCVHLMIKPAYLFDLFPCSMATMRLILNDLSAYVQFSAILLLKYSSNDIVMINRAQLTSLIESSVLVIDLTSMTVSETHPALDQVVTIACVFDLS